MQFPLAEASWNCVLAFRTYDSRATYTVFFSVCSQQIVVCSYFLSFGIKFSLDAHATNIKLLSPCDEQRLFCKVIAISSYAIPLFSFCLLKYASVSRNDSNIPQLRFDAMVD